MLRWTAKLGLLLLSLFCAMPLAAHADSHADSEVTGYDAIKAVIGKPVIFKNSDGTSILNFDSKINFRLKRPAPYNDELKGKLSQGTSRSIICLSYGKVIPSPAMNCCSRATSFS